MIVELYAFTALAEHVTCLVVKVHLFLLLIKAATARLEAIPNQLRLLLARALHLVLSE